MTLLYLLLVFLFATLAWRDLKLAIFVLAGTLPVYLLRFDLLGIPSTMLEVMVWVLVVIWVVKGWRERRWKFGGIGVQNSMFDILRVPITLILIAAVISTLVAPDTTAALGILKAYFVEPLLIFVLVVSVFDRDDLPKLFTSLGASVLVLSLYAIFQKLTGLGIPEPWDTARRVTSIFEYPNALGLFLAPIVATAPFVLSRFLIITPSAEGGKRRDIAKLFWILVFISGVVALIFSETEAAWIAIPAALFLLSLTIKKTRKMSLVLTALALVLILVSPVRDSLIQKVTLQDFSGQVRLSQWSETIDYLRDDYHWILGAGLSGYPTALKPYHTATPYEIFQYPHHIFLNVWVELGVIGLIGLLGLIRPLTVLIRKQKNDVFVLAASAGLLTMLLHGLVDVPYFKNDLAILTWLFVAIILIASKNKTPARG